jgi:hypothetical protein
MSMALQLVGCGVTAPPLLFPGAPSCDATPEDAASAAVTAGGLRSDAWATVQTYEEYATIGFGVLGHARALDSAGHVRWAAALAAHAPHAEPWRCRTAFCYARLADTAILDDIGAVNAERATQATLVLEVVHSEIAALHLVYGTTDGPVGEITAIDAHPASGPPAYLGLVVCPAGELFVDGRFVGLAPRLIRVSPGAHQVEVRAHVLRGEVELIDSVQPQPVAPGSIQGITLDLHGPPH